MDITDHEVDVFDFLVKWHDYQTKDLGRSLRLTSKLFQCVRYSLIIPQILTYRVMPRTNLVDKQQLIDAYYYMYTSTIAANLWESITVMSVLKNQLVRV